MENQQQGSLDLEHLFEDDQQLSRGGPTRILFSLYKAHVGKLLMSMLFYMFKHSPVWVLPIVTANIIDIASDPKHHSSNALLINCAVIAFVIVQNIPTSMVYIAFMSKAIRHVEAGLRSTLVRKLQHLSISFHGDLRSGKLQSKVLRDVEAIEFLSKQTMLSLLPAIINVIVASAITVTSSLTVASFFLFTIPAAVVIVYVFRGKIRKTNREFRKEIEEMSGKVSEMVEMIPITRAHGLEHVEIQRIDSTLMRLKSKGYRLDMVEGYFGATSWVTFQIFQVLCLLFTSFLAYKGHIKVGDVVMYQGFFSMILGSLTQLINIYPQMAKGFESINSVTEILLSKELEEYQGKKNPDVLRGGFSFQNVQFQYKEADKHVLRGFHLNVKPGECIAFVGESGAGKSTVLNMIIGFYKPSQGEILVDGCPMDDLDMQQYRHQLAVVPQNNILFSGSIRDNITYGLPSISEERLQQVMDMANLREFIDKLPEGIDTKVGEHGGKLSGGQRQRIAIARALIRDPKVIILDEATSALDNISEFQVQKAMRQLIKGRTTFIVAHRLSTIRDADRIVVMKNGTVSEVGSYEELMNRQGDFYHLKKMQA